MDTTCLNYQLSVNERTQFDRDGFFIVEDAISPEMVDRLLVAADRVDGEERAANNVDNDAPHNTLDFIGRDDVFLELLDCSKTIAKVWGILGWNIQLYHSHMIVSPPPQNGEGKIGTMRWHQDSGRLNFELETNPQPRISLKVAFFLTDTSELGRANLYVVPGSHLRNKIAIPEDGTDPTGALAVQAKPGDAVFFDRRIWHRSSHNTSHIPRKVLFYGYSYRWLRPRDDMSVEHYMDRCDPIQRQLLGASPTGGHGYSSPKDIDVPLRAWMQQYVGEQALAA